MHGTGKGKFLAKCLEYFGSQQVAKAEICGRDFCGEAPRRELHLCRVEASIRLSQRIMWSSASDCWNGIAGGEPSDGIFTGSRLRSFMLSVHSILQNMSPGASATYAVHLREISSSASGSQSCSLQLYKPPFERYILT